MVGIFHRHLSSSEFANGRRFSRFFLGGCVEISKKIHHSKERFGARNPHRLRDQKHHRIFKKKCLLVSGIHSFSKSEDSRHMTIPPKT